MESSAQDFFPLEEVPTVKNGGSCYSSANSGSFRDVLFKYVPILEWLPAYPWKENSPKDLAGAATLGCILVAQSLAHADLCKVALVSGPYSCILPPVVYSLFGTCVHSSVGTGGLISLLTGIQLEKYGDLEARSHAGPIFTLLVGVIISLMGVLRLAFMVRFLSKPALSGFITASALLIIASQLKPMLGLPKEISGGILDILFMTPWEMKHCHWPTCQISLISIIFLVSAKKLRRVHWCLKGVGEFKELVALALSALFCYYKAEALGIDVVGKVPSGLPATVWPIASRGDLLLAKEMIPGAFLVALVTFLSSFAGAKKFAMKAGYQVVAINELIALGLANVVGSLNAAVPTQIGLSRMGIAYAAGIRSQLGANVYVAVVVAAAVYAFSACLYYIPRCVLNAIIVNGASHLMEFEHMLWLWSLKACPGSKRDSGSRMFRTDFSVWWFSCLGTLYFGAFEGIVLTVLLSLALVVHQVVHPSITPLGCEVSGDRRAPGAGVRGWKSLSNMTTRSREGILVFRVEGPLFYANIERVQEWLEDAELRGLQQGRRPLRAIVLMAASVPFVDSTALMAFKTMVEAYADRGVHFLIAKAAGQPKRFFLHVYSKESEGPAGAHTFAADAVKTCVEGDFSVEDCIAWLQNQESGCLNRTSSQLLLDARKEASPIRSGLERVSSKVSNKVAFEETDELWPPPAPQPLKRASLWASHPDLVAAQELSSLPHRKSFTSRSPEGSAVRVSLTGE
jgi:high affinity sulfate transporter 1